MSIAATENLSRARNVVIAAFLGWMLDAFDFFILIFTFDDVAKEFGVSLTSISFAIALTLATRAAGAFIFGRLGDRFGRKPILIVVILLYSGFEALSGLAWSFASFLVIRTLFGVAMGGEWGLGASLTMETVPARWRGWVSGLLQAGYPTGYFLATILFGVGYHALGWRGMFFVGATPALLALFIAAKVEESPVFREMAARPRVSGWMAVKNHLPLALYAVIMMMAFNFFSHGTQDIYPKAFLGKQLKFSHETITNIALLYNLGAILGGIGFGMLSQKIGRRAAIAAACALSLVVVYPWSHGSDPMTIAVAAFVMQVAVQGAWGIVPVHLNELSPQSIRATFPGFVYQLGNFLAFYNGPLQLAIGAAHGHDYGFPLMLVASCAAIALIVLMLFKFEQRNVAMGHN